MADYDTLIDEIITTKTTRQQFLEKSPGVARAGGLLGGTALETSSLTPAQLLAAVETKLVDQDFLNTLSIRDKDLPDILQGKYDPEAMFKLAYEAMANSLGATILQVMKTVQQSAIDVGAYWPPKPDVDWQARRTASADAFHDFITMIESANIETNAAYAVMKSALSNIAAQIKPLTGLPKDITPQVAAVYKLSHDFAALTSTDEFAKLFTLSPTKSTSLTTKHPRVPGTPITTTTTSPYAILGVFRKAGGHNKTNRQRYWAQWAQLIDGLDMAMDGLKLYMDFGFSLSTTATTTTKDSLLSWVWGLGTKGTTTSVTSSTQIGRDLSDMQDQLSATRDQLAIKISAVINMDPLREAQDTARAIGAMPLPPKVGTTPDKYDEEIQENKQYLKDILALLIKRHSGLK